MFDKIEQHGLPERYPPRDHICHYKQVSINEYLVVPCVKPPIEQLLEVKVHPVVDECVIIETPVGKKLVIKGYVEQKIIYVADVPCQSVHAAHFTIPFCHFEEISSSCIWSTCDLNKPNVLVEYVCAQKTGPKEIAKCVILFIWWPKKSHHLPPCPPPVPPCPPSPCSTGESGTHHHHNYVPVCKNCSMYGNCPIQIK